MIRCCDTLCMEHSWLETSIMWRRLPPSLDKAIQCRWYLTNTTFPVPLVESGKMDSVACLKRQWIVAHPKSSNFKNVQKGQNIEDSLG